MAIKTLTPQEYKSTTELLDKVATPAMEKIVDEINKTLTSKGIRVGAEITWHIDAVSEE